MPETLQLLTPEMAASMLGVSAHYLLSLPIRRLRFGHRTIRYHIDDVLEYLRSSKAERRAGDDNDSPRPR